MFFCYPPVSAVTIAGQFDFDGLWHPISHAIFTLTSEENEKKAVYMNIRKQKKVSSYFRLSGEEDTFIIMR